MDKLQTGLSINPINAFVIDKEDVEKIVDDSNFDLSVRKDTREVAFFEKKAPQKSFHIGVIKMNLNWSVAGSFSVRYTTS